MNRMQRHQRYWQALMKANPQQRKQLVRYVTPDQVDAASEMAYNVLRGTPSLPRSALNKLRPFKNVLRHMGNPRKSLASRRKWVRQNGGSAVSALVKGVVKGLKQGAKKGLKEQKGKIVEGIKKSATRTLRKKVDKILPSEDPEKDDDQEQDTRKLERKPAQSRIEKLQREIEDMELALKQKST